MGDGDGDDGVRYPQTINDELRELGQLPDDVDDMGDAVAVFFGRSAPIDLDGTAASAAAAVAAATSPSDAASLASSTTTGKRRSPVWADFDEVKETVDGEERVIAICKFCKSRLSAKSAHGTKHLLRHQKSCQKKSDQANLV